MKQVIIRPVLTEKSVGGEASGKYTFVLAQGATKVDVKNFLKTAYGVDVASVNVKKQRAKFRWGKGRRQMQKRKEVTHAIVTLKAGQKLDLTKLKTK